MGIRKKKVTAVILTALFLGIFLSVRVYAADSDFTVTNGVLMKYEGNGGNVVIPDGVIAIGDHAFSDCAGLQSIEISDSVVKIGVEAFQNCTGLTRVTIPAGVKEIGRQAFFACGNLEYIEIPKSVTDIGGFAFHASPWLKNQRDASDTGLIIINDILIDGSGASGDVVVPDTVKKIAAWASPDNKGLTGIVIPNGITEIGHGAFMDCTNLKKAKIPDSVTRIGEGAFTASGLTEVSLPGSLTVIDDHLFYKCNSLKSITIPDSVKEIGICAFAECTSLIKAEIPGSVTQIGMSAFWGCKGLTAVEIPASVTKIGAQAFAGTGLREVTFPENVKEIGCGAVIGCPDLTKVTIENKAAAVMDAAVDQRPNIFGVRGGSDDSVNVYKVVNYKGKSIQIRGHENSTADKLALHINNYKGDYGYQSVQFIKLDSVDAKALLAEVEVTSALNIRKGKSGQIKVTLPAGLVKASSYTGKDGQVKITYKTGNKKIAAVNKNGKVTGRKKGSTRVTVTVKLQDGTKKDFYTKVEVNA